MIALMTQRCSRHRYAPASRFAVLLDLFQVWRSRTRERRALLKLDDRMLKDVGLSRADVANETGKPFWQD